MAFPEGFDGVLRAPQHDRPAPEVSTRLADEAGAAAVLADMHEKNSQRTATKPGKPRFSVAAAME
jgi:hypothetical protein